MLRLMNRSPAWLLYHTKTSHLAMVEMLDQCASSAHCTAEALSTRIRRLVAQVDQLAERSETDPALGLASFLQPLRAASELLAGAAAELRAHNVGAVSGAEIAQLRGEVEETGQLLLGAARVAVLNSSDTLPQIIIPSPAWVYGAFVSLLLSFTGLIAYLGTTLRRRGVLLGQITNLRKREQQARAYSRELLDTLPVPVIVLDEKHRIEYTNAAAIDFARKRGGEGRTASLGSEISTSFGPIAGTAPICREITDQGPNGQIRHLSITAKQMRLGDNVSIFVVSDNTALRDAELRAMTASKLAMLGELSAAIAHELNQPLAVIKAAAANGKTHALAQPQTADRLARVVDKFVRIDQQIDRARHIVSNVRDLARPGTDKWAPFAVSRSMHAAIGLVGQQYQHSGVDLRLINSVPDNVLVMGDAILFEIAVLNVLINAREAFTGRSLDAPATVRVGMRYVSGNVEIVISDNAGGIDEQVLPKIFDSFVSTKTAENGTGLGLSIARRAIEGMSGSISAANHTNGAVFSITLPARQQEAVA